MKAERWIGRFMPQYRGIAFHPAAVPSANARYCDRSRRVCGEDFHRFVEAARAVGSERDDRRRHPIGDRLREHQGSILGATDVVEATQKVDVGPEGREIETLARADVPVGDLTVMERDPQRLGRLCQRLPRGLEGTTDRVGARVGENGKHAVSHEFQDLSPWSCTERSTASK